MKKRILSLILACVVLLSSDGFVYAAETRDTALSQETETKTLSVEENVVESQTTEQVEDGADLKKEGSILPAAPEKVTWSETSVEKNRVVLKWNPTKEADGYSIYRKSASETEAREIAVLNEGKENSFTDTVDWGENESYSYFIQAYRTYQDAEGTDGILYGEISEEKTVIPQIEVKTVPQRKSQKPGAPVLTLTECRYDTVGLSWNALSLPTTDSGYYIYRIENGTAKIIAEFERNSQGYTIYPYTNGVKNVQMAETVGNLTTLSYREKNVVHNKTYQFQVAAYVDKSIGEQVGTGSNVITAMPKMQIPTLVSVTAKSYNTAELTWIPTGDNPDEYEVYRKTAGNASYEKIATTQSASYTDKTLKAGQKYYYKVRSRKGLANGSTISSASSASKDIKTKPSATSIQASSSSYTSVKVSWKKVDGAKGYAIYRSTSQNGTYKRIGTAASGKTVSYTDKKLTTGRTYYYKVRAYCLLGETKVFSAYSNISGAKVVPAAPKTSTVSSVNYNTLKINWNKVSEANGYALYRSTSAGGKYTKIATIKNTKTLSYTDTKLTTGKKYYYKVRAYRTVKGSKVYGTYSEAKFGTPIPEKVKGAKAVSTHGNKIHLTWNKVTGAKSYTIYRSTSAKGTYQAVKSGCTKTSYTDTGLKNGVKYYYRIAAVRRDTRGKMSSYVSAKAVTLNISATSVTIQKGEQQKITAVSSPKATVKWSSANKKVAKVSSKGTITGVNVGSTKIHVKANGVIRTIRVTVIPASSTISSVSSTNYNTLTIQWKKVSGADGYVLYRSTSKNGSYKKIASLKSSKVSYTDTKLTTGKKYYYKVRAYQTIKKKKVYGKYSAVKSGTPIPEKVKGAKATPSHGNKIGLTWKKVSGAKSYTIYRSTSAKGTYQAIKTGYTKTSYTDTGLKNGVKYYYRVAAVRGNTRGKMSSYVSAKAATLNISTSSIKIQQGMTQKVTAVASPKATVKWSSSNTKVAKVSSNGTITGVSAGTAKIYAKANGVTRTITVKVEKILNGIDVSKWQGDIDFNAVKKAGIDFVMIRVYNGYTVDPYFESNYKKAKAAGLNIGVYYYTYATTMQQAQQDAMTVLGILNGRSLQYPVTIDMEDASLLNGLSNTDRTDILWTFCSTIQQNSKYKYALYANLNWLNNYFENHRLVGMPIWIARYCDPSLGHRYTGAGNVFMWQYTSQGTLPGINGYVDMNFAY